MFTLYSSTLNHLEVLMLQSSDGFLKSVHLWAETFMRHSMRHLIQYTRDNGLSMSQINAMFHIHHKGSCGVSDIGDFLGITSAAASQLLDRLVQQGFILRTEAPQDRRLKHIVLTELGSQVLHESIQAHQKWLDDLAATLSPVEQQQVSSGLNILINKMDLLVKLPDSGP
jgi:DNA-binding MarR family transcriptional regulator